MENGPRREDILAFVERQAGRRPGPLDEADLFYALGLDGEAADDFMAAFAREFSVDLAGYEPEYHHHDEGGIPTWPLRRQYTFGVRVPLTVSNLLDAARSGRWRMRYPLLEPVPSRHVINIPLIVLGLPVVVLLVLGLFQIL